MADTTTYHVERLTLVTMRDFQPDVLRERADEAWVRVDTLETTKSSYAAMEEWFETGGAGPPEPGRYRLVEFTSYGGNFIEFEVKQKLILEEVRRLAEVA